LVYAFNPLNDGRWSEFIEGHPHASVFHTTGWLEALQRSYGYVPVGYTTSRADQPLANGMVFCRVSSWLTGSRMVSLPFSDHCEPLIDNEETYQEIIASLKRIFVKEKLRYIELRPRSAQPPAAASMQAASRFVFHALDLRPALAELFQQLQKDCIQRKIRRAEREGLSYQRGRSNAILENFYDLLLLTRRRHGVPPQPMNWFRNLIAFLGDRMEIHLATKEGQPVASLLTLRHGHTVVYKYGCSDVKLHNLGGIPFLFWKVIERAKEDGLQQFDLGRSDTDNAGLITFKDRLGASRSTLTYLRCSAVRQQRAGTARGSEIARRVFERIPNGLLSAAGKLLYRHVG
jgi:CelD/BcsL family acetyltransferase involved in cellulose biosynthesis